MLLPNEDAINALVKTLQTRSKIVITGVGEHVEEIKNILNSLAHLAPVKLDTLTIVGDVITVEITDFESGSKKLDITAEELIKKIPIVIQEITKDLITAKTTLSGLVYSKYADAPLYYSRLTNNLFKSTTEQVPAKMIPKYLEHAQNLYEKHLKDFMPAMHALDTQRSKAIRDSQISRGFEDIPDVGMKVKIMPYADMIVRHGEKKLNDLIVIANPQSPFYGVAYIKPLAYLAEHEATITSINQTSGAVKLECMVDGKNIFDISEMTIDGEVYQLDPAPKFNESHLIKA